MQVRINAILHDDINNIVITPKAYEFENALVDRVSRMTKALFVYARSFIKFGRCKHNFGPGCNDCTDWVTRLFKGSDNLKLICEIVSAMDDGFIELFKAYRQCLMLELDCFYHEINAAAMEVQEFLGKVFGPVPEVGGEVGFGDNMSPCCDMLVQQDLGLRLARMRTRRRNLLVWISLELEST